MSLLWLEYDTLGRCIKLKWFCINLVFRIWQATYFIDYESLHGVNFECGIFCQRDKRNDRQWRKNVCIVDQYGQQDSVFGHNHYYTLMHPHSNLGRVLSFFNYRNLEPDPFNLLIWCWWAVVCFFIRYLI